ncbi:MAG: FUSC family protein [Actinomycetota bacterium]
MAPTPAQLVRDARSRRGPERDTLLTIVKSTGATLAAYAFASFVLGSQAPAFAPFAALFMVQATVYRSLYHALRYLAAVVIGVAATGAIGMAWGQTFWSLALLVFVTVLIGQWRRFRGFGAQIPIVGLFAFAARGGDEPDYLMDLLLTVGSGALIGLAVNLLLAPSLRFSSTAQGIEDVSTAVRDLLLDMAGELRGGDPLDDVDSWSQRSGELLELVDRVHEDVDFSQEAARMNPRRLAVGMPPLATYRTVLTTMTATVDHVDSIVRALTYVERAINEDYDDEGTVVLDEFLPGYAVLLERIARVVELSGEVPFGRGAGLSDALREGYDQHGELAQRLWDVAPSDSRVLADLGTMLVEAERMLNELEALSG